VKGEVDISGRALVAIDVRATEDVEPTRLNVWIDTAFTGDLAIPRRMIEDLGLPQSAAVLAGLADGTQVVLESYTCVVEWFGESRLFEVIGNDGRFPLLGVGLLRDRRLEVDYPSQSVILD
jgi:clan AA aspartic protease